MGVSVTWAGLQIPYGTSVKVAWAGLQIPYCTPVKVAWTDLTVATLPSPLKVQAIMLVIGSRDFRIPGASLVIGSRDFRVPALQIILPGKQPNSTLPVITPH